MRIKVKRKVDKRVTKSGVVSEPEVMLTSLLKNYIYSYITFPVDVQFCECYLDGTALRSELEIDIGCVPKCGMKNYNIS